MTKVVLRKPVQAHGETIDTLTFREPTGEDIIACGYPLQMGDGAATPIAGVIAKYIGRLGGIPASSVGRLSASDFQACMAAILPFFGDGEPGPAPANGD